MSKTDTSAEEKETEIIKKLKKSETLTELFDVSLEAFAFVIQKLTNEHSDTLTDIMTKLRSRDDLPSDDPGYIDFHNLVTGVLNTLIAIVLDDRDVKTKSPKKKQM